MIKEVLDVFGVVGVGTADPGGVKAHPVDG